MLVLEGTVPDFLLSEHVEDLVAAIPNAELTWIEDSGHFAPSEKAEEWNAEVLAFLDTVEADRLAAKVTEIEVLVENTMEEAQIPGVALGIVKDGELVYAEGFGVAELGKDDPVTPQTVFHLASIGKTVVGTAVLQLVEQGKIDLDAPIVDYLPYFQLADERYEEITVRQMLAHISGMPDVEDYEWDNPVYDDEAAERYVRSLNEFELLTPPGEEFAYSSMAYDLMGDVIAKASGQSFEEYVQENIFTPLGMENTTYLMPEADAAMLAAPHEIDDSGAVIVRDVYPYNRMHAPSSTLKSNVEDMARYAMAHMNHGELDGATILEPSSYDELWAEQAETGWGDNVNYYGLGWFVGNLDGHPIYHHLGADDGFNANFAVAPDDSIGVIVMLNLMDRETFEGDFHVSSIAEPAMEILLGVAE